MSEGKHLRDRATMSAGTRHRPRRQEPPSAVARVAGGLGVIVFKALIVGMWGIGAYPLLVATLLLGGLAAVGLTAVSAEIYEAVAEADGVAGLDQPVLHLAVAVRTPQMTGAVTAFTDLGGQVGMTMLAAVAAISLAIWHRRWTPVVLIAAAGAGSLLMTVVGKQVVGRIRPPLHHAVPPYETSGSFPSGHTLNAVVIAGVVAYLMVLGQRRWAARVATVAATAGFSVAMGLSRVLLGHHWLTDVLVAWTLGLAWLSIVIAAHQLYATAAARDRPQLPVTHKHP